MFPYMRYKKPKIYHVFTYSQSFMRCAGKLENYKMHWLENFMFGSNYKLRTGFSFRYEVSERAIIITFVRLS